MNSKNKTYSLNQSGIANDTRLNLYGLFFLNIPFYKYSQILVSSELGFGFIKKIKQFDSKLKKVFFGIIQLNKIIKGTTFLFNLKLKNTNKIKKLSTNNIFLHKNSILYKILTFITEKKVNTYSFYYPIKHFFKYTTSFNLVSYYINIEKDFKTYLYFFSLIISYSELINSKIIFKNIIN